MKDLDQTFRIKRLLADRGETITSMALQLGEPYGSVANNVYGYRRQHSLQEKIAAYLNREPKEVFNAPGKEDGHGQ